MLTYHVKRIFDHDGPVPIVFLVSLIDLIYYKLTLQDHSQTWGEWSKLKINQIIKKYADEAPQIVALIQADDQVTYAELDMLSNQIANGLTALGVRSGDRIALISENSIDQALVYVAASKIGAVTVPLNYRLSPSELGYIIQDSEAKALMVLDEKFIPVIEAIKYSGDFTPKTLSVGEAFPATWKAWNSWVAAQSSAAIDVEADGNDPVIQLYTSGTTGNPKGAVLSHNNFIFISQVGAQDRGETLGVSSLITAPMFHIGGGGSLVIAMLTGGTAILQSVFDPIQFVNAIEKYGLKNVFMVPAMIQAVLTVVPNCRERDFSNLERITYGASPISEKLLREAMEVFGCEFCQAYGMTETCGVISLLSPEDHLLALEGRAELLTSCGRAVDGVEMNVVDEEGNSVPLGELGEIVARSPSNMSGYWHLGDETKKTVRNGWLHTGDAGYRDADGYYYLRDRIKDMVISGGENIYPLEVERILNRHEAIADLAVIGIADETYGEALLAVCVLVQGKTLSVDEMIEHCRDHLAGFKIPRRIEFMDILPRNASGKILKKDLRAAFG